MDNGASSYRRFLEGEKSAFSEILDLYRDNLIFFINRTVHNLHVAEDLAADCFVELLIHPKRYNFQYSLKTYLFTIAHHKTVNYIRHNKRSQPMSVEELEEKSEAYLSFEEDVLRSQQRQAVHKALETLKEEYRSVLHLLYFEELSYEEAAKVMGKNKKQIDNLAYRAKGALRNILEKEGISYEG